MKLQSKKIAFRLLSVLFVWIFLSLGLAVVAQDSTIVKVADGALESLSLKFPIIVVIMGIIGTVDTLLAMIPDKYVPANGVCHAIILWAKALSSGFKKP